MALVVERQCREKCGREREPQRPGRTGGFSCHLAVARFTHFMAVILTRQDTIDR